MTTDTINVMIVDDHDMVRHGLAAFVNSIDDLNLVGEAANGKQAIAMCNETDPDVVLMDMIMPEMDGVEATKVILSEHPEIQVIALTSFKKDDLKKAVLEAGAFGYLLKNASIDELASTIRAAYAARIGQPH